MAALPFSTPSTSSSNKAAPMPGQKGRWKRRSRMLSRHGKWSSLTRLACSSYETSHDAFRSAFPRGFAWEVISVYSGPPVITYKFRHWGFSEGPFRGHAPTGEMVQFFGISVMRVNNVHYFC
ncbi:unnamed protein product [Linum tenue]|uniref:Uncharacterized protein n=2 Tax=Linum tenue TaxID=586396 RepID=A0AAV0JJL7_9ROSI|nr:unnamed protein product [Linum tenue]